MSDTGFRINVELYFVSLKNIIVAYDHHIPFRRGVIGHPVKAHGFRQEKAPGKCYEHISLRVIGILLLVIGNIRCLNCDGPLRNFLLCSNRTVYRKSTKKED